MSFSEVFAHLLATIIGGVIGGILGIVAGFLAALALIQWSVWAHPDQPDAASIGIMAIATVPGGAIFGAVAGAAIGWKVVAAEYAQNSLRSRPAPLTPPRPTPLPPTGPSKKP